MGRDYGTVAVIRQHPGGPQVTQPVNREQRRHPERRTYTVEEAAHILGIGRNQAYDAAKNGELPTVKLGRRLLVPRDALERLLAGDSAA
jgi:excisionase family DNA binding protein